MFFYRARLFSLFGFDVYLGLGRLPGDIVIEHGNFRFYFPLVTCLIISIVLSFFL